MVALTLPDGNKRAFDGPVSGADAAAAIGRGLAKAALAIRVNHKIFKGIPVRAAGAARRGLGHGDAPGFP